MSRRDVVTAVALIAALSAGVAALVDWPAFRVEHYSSELVVFLLVGVAYVAAGTIAWHTRPYDNTGRLLVLAGLLWQARGFGFSSNPFAFTIGSVLTVTVFAALIQVSLGFPLGRLRQPWERRFVGGIWAYYLVSAALELTVGDTGPIASQHPEPINILFIRDSETTQQVMQAIFGVCDISIGLIVAAVLIRRWRKGTSAYRAAFAPVWIATMLGTVVAVAVYVGNASTDTKANEWAPNVAYTALTFLPIAVVVGLWRYRGARAVSEVMVEVGAAPLGEGFTSALRRALRDPSLVLWSWSPERKQFVDADGVPQALPSEGADRAVTVLERDGAPVGALVYDKSLRDQPQLIAAVRSATVVTLDNRRLQTELEAQLEEVRRSRGRIVAAGDEQRRRLERNLHDGAQQRLVAAAILLRRAQRSKNEEQLRELLAQGAVELDIALVELRELARGVYPPVLQERGLGAALDSLAERAPLPLEIRDGLTTRPPAAVELAAYYIAAEAVANASKHSSASLIEISLQVVNGELRVEVSDDGVGGASFEPGGGLTGLLDRAAALGGRLLLKSPVGRGTTLTVTLPIK
ncbi:sensor histidine kinase [Antrihabitans stalactiti]|uniref:sensor histidine kinase n=1 Tax=Antrihabitans stalactiti TaxID=2584121 RepID=UPI0030B812B5